MRQALRNQLPGELMMWVLILSELAVFGAGLLVLRAVWLTDPDGFRAAQGHLNAAGAAVNTVVLVTSGWLAALAVRAERPRGLLVGAAALGLVFLVINGAEYAAKAAEGISFETHPFFLFYYLLTGFHVAHVIAGVVILALVAVRPAPASVEAGAQLWHMVDLVWVLLFPVVYLL